MPYSIADDLDPEERASLLVSWASQGAKWRDDGGIPIPEPDWLERITRNRAEKLHAGFCPCHPKCPKRVTDHPDVREWSAEDPGGPEDMTARIKAALAEREALKAQGGLAPKTPAEARVIGVAIDWAEAQGTGNMARIIGLSVALIECVAMLRREVEGG